MTVSPNRRGFVMVGLAQAPRRHHLRLVAMSLTARFLVALVRAYQIAISPWLGNVCRFEPSCSRYALACLRTHGALRGSLLSVRRLCKCHPFHPGGVDPPPPARIAARPF